MNLITVYGNTPQWQPTEYGVVHQSISTNQSVYKALTSVLRKVAGNPDAECTTVHGLHHIEELIEQYGVEVFTNQPIVSAMIVKHNDKPDDVAIFFASYNAVTASVSLRENLTV